MKVFRCTCPDRPVLFFENVQCGRCRRLTGFCANTLTLKPFVAARGTIPEEPATRVWADDDDYLYMQCSNWTAHSACNWMLPLRTADARDHDRASARSVDHPVGHRVPGATDAVDLHVSPDQPRLCRGCRLNEIIPDLTVQQNITLWRKLEIAKRRCLYSLLSLELPVGDASTVLGGTVPELAFRFLADRDSTAHFENPLPGETPVLTGHQEGVVTINLAEADDIARTRMRVNMDEHYRTLLGHFRHETGHYYWDVFRLADAGFLNDFRAVFGDETRNYAAAVQSHYSNGPADQWQQRFVSPYASMHPWEDWAETWAHYLHIIDTLQTRRQFGEPSVSEPDMSGSQHLSGIVSGNLPSDGPITAVDDEQTPAGVTGGAGGDIGFNEMMSHWIGTSIMLNSLNRSMGLPDPYPFVLNREVKRKLRFVDEAIRRFGQNTGTRGSAIS